MNNVFFFNSIQLDNDNLRKGDEITLQVLRTGKWSHPFYGEIKVTKKTINNVIENFNNKERGIELVLDENHEMDHKALGVFKELFKKEDGNVKKKDNALFARIELTKKGADMLNDGSYLYFSPEIIFGETKDEETGKVVTDLLIGGGLTNRPFFKKMEPVQASENASNQQQESSTKVYFFTKTLSMDKFKELLAKAQEKEILSFGEKTEILESYSELSDEEKTDELQEAVNTETDKPQNEDQLNAKAEDSSEEVSEDSTEEEKKEEDSEEEKEEEKEEAQAVSASEQTFEQKFNDSQATIARLQKKVDTDTHVAKFNELAVSNENRSAIFNASKHQDDYVSFMLSLNPGQVEVANKLFNSIQTDVASKFEEKGTSEDVANLNEGDAYMAKIQKIANEKGVSLSEAKSML